MTLEPSASMPETRQAAPAPPQPAALLVLLHGWGANAQDMAVLAQALGPCLPQALVLAPQGFETAAGQPGARQWFEVQGMTPANRAQRAGVAPEHTIASGLGHAIDGCLLGRARQRLV